MKKDEELKLIRKALMEERNPDAANQAIWFLIERAVSIDSKLSWVLGVLGLVSALLIALIALLV